MLSVQIVPIKSENGEMKPESLEYAYKNENITGIYLIPDYHNPTASFMSVENRKVIAEIAKSIICLLLKMHRTIFLAKIHFQPLHHSRRNR